MLRIIKKFFIWIWMILVVCYNYFRHRIFEKHLFQLAGFDKKYYAAYKIIAANKRKNRMNWLLNNFIFPFCVVLSPLLLTAIHKYFNTVSYNKDFVEIIIGGSLTLLGINVLRTSSTLIAEKLNYDNVPPNYQSKITEIENEISLLKKRLTSLSWILSFIGFLLYFLQIGQFINNTSNIIYWFIVGIFLVFCLSLFLGRFITLMESNLFEKEEFTKLLFSKLITQNQDIEKLETLLKNQGL